MLAIQGAARLGPVDLWHAVYCATPDTPEMKALDERGRERHRSSHQPEISLRCLLQREFPTAV
jgi:hypothetical protein